MAVRNRNPYNDFVPYGETQPVPRQRPATGPRTNRYAADCSVCGARVPANGGSLRKSGRTWLVTHLACEDGTPRVVTTVFNSGAVVTQNAGGRCEDAPCCGCCSY